MSSLHDLIAKLQRLEEAPAAPAPAAPAPAAPAPAAPAPAAPAADDFETKMKNYEAGKAKAAAVEAIKKYMSKPVNQIGRLENLIDPATGFIYYGEAGLDAFKGTPRKMLTRFMSQGDQQGMMNAITAAGLKVVDNGGYAQIDPASLKALTQPAAPAPAPAPAPAASTTSTTGSDQSPAAPANAEAQKKIDRLKTILGLNVSNATANTTTGANMAKVNESIVTFKSSIGRLLAEEFGVLEAPEAPAVAAAQASSNTVAPNARQEADALWSELSTMMNTPGALTPQQRADIENLTQAYQQFQQNNPLPQAQTVDPSTTPTKPTKPTPTKPNSSSKIGYKNPGTIAFQNWLNTNGVKVAVDGRYGPETQGAIDKLRALKPKEFGNGASRWQEMMDMLGVGTAFNVIQGQGTSLGSPKYLESMKKYGYDPKTGNPVGGNNGSSQSPVKPTAPGKAKSIPELDAAIKAASDKVTQVAAAKPNSPELAAAQAELMAVVQQKAQAMKANTGSAASPVNPADSPTQAYAYTTTPEYKALLAKMTAAMQQGGPESPAYKKALADFEAFAAKNKPVAESSGYSSDELSRIVSLVYHR